MLNEPEMAPELQLISVDDNKLRVLVRSKAARLEDQHYQLNSEDAKTFAIRAAHKAGLNGAMVKHAMIQYGDAETGTPAKKFDSREKCDPFLVVEVYSEDLATSRAIGDSHIPSGRGM